MNFQKSKIYAVKSANSDLVYIGSTTSTLNDRLYKHKSTYKNYIENRGAHNMTVNKVLECGDCFIELIKEFPCETKKELLIEEGKEMLKFETENPDKLVNRCIAGLTIQEQNKRCYEKHKEKRLEESKNYRETHKEEIKEYKHKHYEKNKEHISQKNREWAKNNHDKVLEAARKNREKRKDDPEYKKAKCESAKKYKESHPEKVHAEREKAKEKVECECGMVVSRKSLKRHQQRPICKLNNKKS